MSNLYTWVIHALEVIPKKDGKTNVLVSVSWSLFATDGTNTISLYDKQILAQNTTNLEFIEFSDLTKEQVVIWVKESLGEDVLKDYYSSLDTHLKVLFETTPHIQPLESVSIGLPWEKSC
jgi:hypothetical protein